MSLGRSNPKVDCASRPNTRISSAVRVFSITAITSAASPVRLAISRTGSDPSFRYAVRFGHTRGLSLKHRLRSVTKARVILRLAFQCVP